MILTRNIISNSTKKPFKKKSGWLDIPVEKETTPLKKKVKVVNPNKTTKITNAWGDALGGIDNWNRAIYDVEIRTIKMIDEDQGRVQL